jgi:hypothetical protein
MARAFDASLKEGALMPTIGFAAHPTTGGYGSLQPSVGFARAMGSAAAPKASFDPTSAQKVKQPPRQLRSQADMFIGRPIKVDADWKQFTSQLAINVMGRAVVPDPKKLRVEYITAQEVDKMLDRRRGESMRTDRAMANELKSTVELFVANRGFNTRRAEWLQMDEDYTLRREGVFSEVVPSVNDVLGAEAQVDIWQRNKLRVSSRVEAVGLYAMGIVFEREARQTMRKERRELISHLGKKGIGYDTAVITPDREWDPQVIVLTSNRPTIEIGTISQPDLPFVMDLRQPQASFSGE